MNRRDWFVLRIFASGVAPYLIIVGLLALAYFLPGTW